MKNRTHHRTMLVVVTMLLVLGLLPAITRADDEGSIHGTELWVTGQDTDQIWVLNGAHLEHTIPLPAGTGPHMPAFSPDGRYAYVSGLNSGDVLILDASSYQSVATLDFGAKGVHEARPSPDGSIVMVAQQESKELIRVAANPSAGSWTETGRLTLPAVPVCTIFVPGTNKAYVTYSGQDIAILDVAAMQITGTIDIDGQSRCNYDWARDGKRLYLTAENGTDSFLYQLDPRSDAVTLLHTFTGVVDLHTPFVSTNGKQISIVGRGNDMYYEVTLADMNMTSFEIGDPGTPDGPDGLIIVGNTAYVNLKATGKLAVIKLDQRDITYVDLVAPSRNAALNIARRPDTLGGGDCRTFNETGRTVCGQFLAFWETHGGLMIFGYPLTGVIDQNGMPIQYFERARFEYHAANAGTGWEVLLGRIGAEQAASADIGFTP